MSEHIPEASAKSPVAAYKCRIPEAWAARMDPLTLRRAEELSRRAAECRDNGETILPPQSQLFRALELTPPESLRCVILGQDPYHTPGVANGLAFSANPGCKVPPSLRNIFKELSADLGCPMPTEPDLTPWAAQGVLLLNTVLTVRAASAGSHANWGWQSVTQALLRVCLTFPQPVMFLLWGRHAQSAAQKAGIPLTTPETPPTNTQISLTMPETPSGKAEILSAERPRNLSEHPDVPESRPCPDGTDLFKQVSGAKAALCSSHPSPLGAAKSSPTLPAFLGSRPFSRTNAFLRAAHSPEISWALP